MKMRHQVRSFVCFLSSPGDSNMQPTLRITGLMLASKKIVLGLSLEIFFLENNPDNTGD